MFNETIDRLGDFNAQLYRELKGKLNPRNLTITITLSLVLQGFIYLVYQNSLPVLLNETNRYCLGNFSGEIDPEYYDPEYYKRVNFCIQDSLGHLNINWPLWNLDIFTCLSIIAIFTLIIAGSYLLIADLTKEEEKGTLNFIRLSPQSAQSFFIGKILGVPILIYTLILFALPLHFITGLQANIPLFLILSFYAVLIFSCAFFYSSSLLFTLVSTELVVLKIWFGTGVLLFGLYILSLVTFNIHSLVGNILDWSVMFYPGTVLTYLIKATNLGDVNVRYLHPDLWDNVTWFRLPLWRNSLTGIGFILVNYLVGIYWLGIGLTRRFYNPDSQILTKKQSYFLSTLFSLVALGFSLQLTNNSLTFFHNLTLLLTTNFLFCLILIVILSPQRQTLQDWSRYRHQSSKKTRSLLSQLIWNDQSPSTLAIVINWLIVSLISLPAIFLLSDESKKFALLLSLVIQVSLLVLFTTITQLCFMLKTKKRNFLALSGLVFMLFFPLITGVIFQLDPTKHSLIWFFSLVPMLTMVSFPTKGFLLALFTQVVAIAFFHLQMTKKLKQLGSTSNYLEQKISY
jgi:ABC-type transport system involved in multi-copper enzyme maturation permease subunit